MLLIAMTAGESLIAGMLVSRPAWHLLRTWYSDSPVSASIPMGMVDDASRLNQTTVTEVLQIPATTAQAEEQLRLLLMRAAKEKLKVSVAGTRHSMGGHTIYPGGVAVDMLPFNHMKLDERGEILHVGSGAQWSEIIPYLNGHGKSVGVMQSNNTFSVGGSISVNCHGWQTGKPPIATTVERFRIMQHDGTITTCSRTENRELFSLALGGYGLFGIILDVDLRVVPNEELRLSRTIVPISEYADRLQMMTEHTTEARLAYGRLDVTEDNILGSAILNVWSAGSPGSFTTSPLSTVTMPQIRRAIFRGSVGDAYGKRLRWWSEQELEPLMGSTISTRNELLNVEVGLFENRSQTDTDILHEYFVPPVAFDKFVTKAREIVKEQKADLLNVTVRDVEPDLDTFLRYADQRMLCLVMLFNQKKTDAGEEQMTALTRALIDAVLDCGGRYYLTYRLHGTHSQIHKAYPQLDQFFSKKREYDPVEIFQNQFYTRYGQGDIETK